MSDSAGPFGIRFHGRGGQGVVTAAELLSVAAFLDGREAQAFPSFGSERMGAPVTSYCRIADTPIRTHEPVSEPDAVVIADSTLLRSVDVFAGLRDAGYVLVNSQHSPEELGLEAIIARVGSGRVYSIPATDLARRIIGRPLPNVCLLGGLAALTAVVSPVSLAAAVYDRFPTEIAERNVAALRAAVELTIGVHHA